MNELTEPERIAMEALSEKTSRTPEESEAQHVMLRQQFPERRGINFIEGPLDEEAKKLGRILLERITNHQPSTVKALYEEFLQLYKIPADGLRGSNGNRAWHCLVAL